MSIRTEDGVEVNVGDRVYNYYDMEPGVIVSDPEEGDGWFHFQADGKRSYTILNGQRVCSIEFAQLQGFRGV